MEGGERKKAREDEKRKREQKEMKECEQGWRKKGSGKMKNKKQQ